MEIIGDKEFYINTKKALKLIKETDLEEYNFVVSRFSVIHQNNISFLYPYSDVIYYVGDSVSKSSDYLYASCLLREAYHTYLVSLNYKKNKSGEYCCYDGIDNMKECYQFQFEMLLKMHAPDDVIESVKNEFDEKLNNYSHQIIIVGNRKFINRIKSALLLLREKDYLSYKVVIQNIRKIVYFPQYHHTYYDAFQEVPTCFINFDDFNYSVENIACALLHEACHNKLYVDAIYENREPHEAASGYSAEMYCLTRQIECLKRISDDKKLLDIYLKYFDYDWWSNPNKLSRIKKY